MSYNNTSRYKWANEPGNTASDIFYFWVDYQKSDFMSDRF